jgi:hypothetical protein
MFLAVSSSALAAGSYDIANLYEAFCPDQQPFIDENNRTLVPVRFVTEQLGANVAWDGAKNQVKITYKGDHIQITPGSDQAIRLTNGQYSEYPMGTKAVLVQGRVMVPLRFLSEAMGFHVVWEERIGAVVINKRMVLNLSRSPLNLTYLTEPEKTGITIKDIRVLQDVYFANDIITTNVTLQNNNRLEKTIWLQLSFKNTMEQSYYTSPEAISIKPGQSLQIPVTWERPGDIVSGTYQASVGVWDRSPEKDGAELLANAEIQGGVRLYKSQESFLEFDNAKWRTTSHMLEGTKLQKHNVALCDGKMMIQLPKGVFEGGEIQSCSPMGFGSYEIRMKIPNVPSSITGFFLYKPPVLYNEIDIEIYNQSNGEYFLTTYSEGEKKNLFIDKLPFDPTAGFHNYRIDYFPNQIRFYADDVLLKEWHQGYTKETMYLVVNTWYPDWLAKVAAKNDNAYLEIDWIRY